MGLIYIYPAHANILEGKFESILLEDSTSGTKWKKCKDTGNSKNRRKGVIKLGEFLNKWDCLDSCRTFNTILCEYSKTKLKYR